MDVYENNNVDVYVWVSEKLKDVYVYVDVDVERCGYGC